MKQKGRSSDLRTSVRAGPRSRSTGREPGDTFVRGLAPTAPQAAARPEVGLTIETHGPMVLLSLSTLVLMSLIFAPIGLWPLAFLCLVPWTILVGGANRAPRVYFYSYVLGLAFFLINMRWLYAATGLGYVALSIYLACYFPLVACPLRHVVRRRRWPLALALPLVWTGSEILRAVVISGFPWFFLSHSLHSVLTLIQVSDLVGAYGVSFLVAAVNGAVADVLLQTSKSRNVETSKHQNFAVSPFRRFTVLTFRAARFSVVFAVVLVLGVVIYGQIQLRVRTTTDGPRIAVIQGDFISTVYTDQAQVAHDRAGEEEKMATYLSMMEAAAKERPDLYLLPESPWVMYLNEEARDFFPDARRSFSALQKHATQHHAVVVTGSATLIPTPFDLLAKERRYNSATVFYPDGREPQRYDKIHLVYFGEVVPFRFGRLRPLYFWFNRLMPFSGPEGRHEYSFFRGEEFRRFSMESPSGSSESYRFAIPICYEDVMPYVSREFVAGPGKLGFTGSDEKLVDILLNISNDGWFGRGTQQPQHLAICVFRAVENRVGIARAVNTGISGFIQPSGRVHDLVRSAEGGPWPGNCGFAVANVGVDSRFTVYSRYGDWFAWGCALLWLALFVDYWMIRARHRDPPKADSRKEIMNHQDTKTPSVVHLHARSPRVGLMFLPLLAGCMGPPMAGSAINRIALKHRAMEHLRAAIRYEHNPAVRVEAVEAMESLRARENLPWIRAALWDAHPSVRFASCVAVGRLGDQVVEQSVRDHLNDEDPSVQVAALFALHALGDTEQTGWMPNYLLAHEDVTVRRNAALVLGLLNEPAAIKVLARAMRDGDAGVRHHALEAMARLGNREAKQELTFMTNAGVGSNEVFAINALAETSDSVYLDTFRYKLATATHLETRLAAARGLGRLGSDEGFEVALEALQTDRPLVHDLNDPASGQVLRAKQMAAAALGAIGRVDALPALAKLLDDSRDPRIQVSAAQAILEILEADRTRGLPFVSTSVGMDGQRSE